ncbi:hypothetical protein BaRGS_00001578 [Batillaria attramentaria]|uniref:Uncharacterized protein n=1 Tax=Batillaria attramentaria TaxID=370345 RepID=A0ABD0M807_9CAEN
MFTVRILEVCMVAVVVQTVYYALTTPTVLCLAALAVLWGVYRRERRRAAGTIPLTGKHVLITGCDTGIGHELAKKLHQLGCHVIATVLLPDGEGAEELRDFGPARMTVLPLDVTSDDSVSKCLNTVKDMCSKTGLWGLVNNAGINAIGELELVTMRQYLHVANINIFGMVRTTRAFLPLIRQAKGRIVNVTSVHGKVSWPNNVAYSITKFAAETFSDITRLEMAQFGVKVVVIEPGGFGFSTNVLEPSKLRSMAKEQWECASDEVKELYGKATLDRRLAAFEKTWASPAGPHRFPVTPVIDALTEALTSDDPELRYLVDGCLKQRFDVYCVLDGSITTLHSRPAFPSADTVQVSQQDFEVKV